MTRLRPAAAPLALALALGGSAPAEAQRALDTSVCRGVALALEAPGGFAEYAWRTLGGSRILGSDSVYALRAETSTVLVSTARPRLGGNEYANARFDDGPGAFDTDYAAAASGVSPRAGTYAVVEESGAFRAGLRDCRDVERDAGPGFKVIASASGGAQAVWRHRFPVAPASRYLANVTAWAQADDTVALRLHVDGLPVGPRTLLADGPCVPRQLNAEFEAAGRTSVVVELRATGTRAGVDFGFDGLVFAERFPSRRDTFVIGVREPPPSDTLTRYACPGEAVALSDGGVARADTLICRATALPGGCDSVACERVAFLDPEDVGAEVAPESCGGEADARVRLLPEGRGPFDVTWADDAGGGLERGGLPPGTYAFSVADAAGCTVRGEAVVTGPAPLRWTEAEAVQPICLAGDLAVVDVAASGGTGPVAFGFRQNGSEVDPVAVPAGVLAIEARDSAGCSLDTLLTLASGPEAEILGPGRVRAGDTVVYELRLDGATVPEVVWRFGGSPDVLSAAASLALAPPASGSLVAEVTLPGGCTGAVERSVEVVDEERRRYFPTAFSPNGDDRNDVFAAVADPRVERVLALTIADRWGGVVLRGGGEDARWDGTVRGAGAREAAEGVYTYAARLLLRGGEEVEVRDVVTLLR